MQWKQRNVGDRAKSASFLATLFATWRLMRRLKMDDKTIRETGRMLKKMTYEFEERLKKRFAASEKVVFDISGLIFWPLVIVIAFALMFPFYYQAT
ncbi:hypothetical protein TNCV_3878051 [Trichonephila clavipes]|nr:hypothetical protein TNCV_3878051 [Trichonephila clavipes]